MRKESAGPRGGGKGRDQSRRLPAHVAVIMDGNGRWAQQRGLRRLRGHQEGANSTRELIIACAEKGIKELTLFVFSTENWRRSRREVDFLMNLMRRSLVRERADLMRNNVCVRVIGRLDALPEDLQREIADLVAATAQNTGLVLRLAFNYGGRAEVLDAVRALADDVQRGRLSPQAIDEAVFRRYLYDPQMSDPDLLIRTGGEMRVSNFLLWHLAYAELWVTPVCWPEFRRPQLEEALEAYARRERRFGAVPSRRFSSVRAGRNRGASTGDGAGAPARRRVAEDKAP